MQLKISSVTNLADARYFSAIGVHYIGFCFDALNENSISVDKAREIVSWLHEPVIVGEFGRHQTREEIIFIAQEMELQEIHIPDDHPQKEELPFQKFLYVEDWFPVRRSLFTDLLVINCTGEDINNPSLKEFISTNKVFVETDFTKENIVEIMKILQPYGIQISCKKEDRAGYRNVDEYAEILELMGF